MKLSVRFGTYRCVRIEDEGSCELDRMRVLLKFWGNITIVHGSLMIIIFSRFKEFQVQRVSHYLLQKYTESMK